VPLSLDKAALYFVFFFFIALTFWAKDIPFFWDSTLYCQISHYHYDNNFSSLLVPPDLDPAGSPMIYWIYIALAWKILGKTLLISHLAVLPFLLGIAWEYYKLAKKFLSPIFTAIAMALLIVEPTFISQSIFLGYDIPKAYLFLFALNALLERKSILFSLAICLLSLSSMRGMFLASSIFLIHLYLFRINKWKNIWKELSVYLPAVFSVCAWMAYHYYYTGWLLFLSNGYYADDRMIVSFGQMFRQFIYILWEMIDFGRAFLWTCVGVGISYFILKKIKLSKHLKFLLFLISTPWLVSIITLCPFSIPVGHKYFIVLFLLSHLLFLYIIHRLSSNKKYIIIIFSAAILSLITGNFWIYAGGFSNGWDSSLKSIPYFKLKNEMIGFVEEKKINPIEIGTKFPIYYNIKISDLGERDFEFSNMKNNSVKEYNYVLLSNISNQFTLAEKETLNNEWELIKECELGQVYLKLFKNPDK